MAGIAEEFRGSTTEEMKSERRALEDEVVHGFDALLVQNGYQRLRTERWRWATTVSYGKNDLGIEFVLDWREFHLFTRIVRLANGALPPDEPYYASEAARRYLETALRALGVVASQLEVSPLPPSEVSTSGGGAIREDLSEQIALLRGNLQLIEQRWPEAFA